ncbi:phosphatase PAP2 family protein [Haloquadratum walsbyi]|uniref:PAP2 superfamily protein n=1 Tax=Haloquadratum walsbyi J07HQW2 TaxID=1238425 RepID=U1NG67_9EURY|nr:phosphatase PAP2 family protein [Haloquadratum walsbyi]ERG95818.1 MAG: PAP2 superfamily protein [Haloquadratum walsbyi J07HQW2]
MSFFTVLTTRGIGESRILSDVPEIVVAVFRILTHLGSPYTLFAMVSVLYLLGRRGLLVRRRAAFMLAIGVAAIGLTIGLKHLFALPRPPASFRSGFGFPSGHAIGITAFWGAAALLIERGQWRHRAVLAGSVITLVAASRVIIGVHYLVDVLAGIAIGIGLLVTLVTIGPGFEMRGQMSALVRPTHTDVTATFGVATLLTIISIVIAPDETGTLLGTGMAAASTAIWHRYGRTLGAIQLPIKLRTLLVGGTSLVIGFGVLITAMIVNDTTYVAQIGAIAGSILIIPYAISTGIFAAVTILTTPFIANRAADI